MAARYHVGVRLLIFGLTFFILGMIFHFLGIGLGDFIYSFTGKNFSFDVTFDVLVFFLLFIPMLAIAFGYSIMKEVT